MVRKAGLAFAGATVLAAMIHAHGQPADPLSGKWGSVETGGAGLDLKFDGRETVTGTLYSTGAGPVPIESGTFNPQTRKLRLAGVAKAPDGRAASFVVEGTLEGDRLVLTYNFGGSSGTASFTRAGTAPPAASGPIVTDAAPALRRNFADVSGWIAEAAELVPADKYVYRPAATVRTFGEMVGHIVDGYAYSCANASGRAVEWSMATEKGKTDKATIVAALKKATAACTAAYENATNVNALVDNVAHASLHYGNLVTYMRMLGLKPPSS